MQLQLREHGQPGLCHTRHKMKTLAKLIQSVPIPTCQFSSLQNLTARKQSPELDKLQGVHLGRSQPPARISNWRQSNLHNEIGQIWQTTCPCWSGLPWVNDATTCGAKARTISIPVPAAACYWYRAQHESLRMPFREKIPRTGELRAPR